jgi:hypothetical protein
MDEGNKAGVQAKLKTLIAFANIEWATKSQTNKRPKDITHPR